MNAADLPRSTFRNTDDAGPETETEDTPAMVRSEERLNISTQTRAVARVRLRKHVVAETVTHQVTVRHEELSIDHEQLDEPRPSDGRHDAHAHDEFEIILHEERVEVRTVVVPVERIRVRVVTVAGEQTVTEVLRREQLDLTTTPDPT